MKTIKDETGQDVKAKIRVVESSNEFWNEYTLDDGTELRVKFVLVEVAQPLDRFDPTTGEPMFFLQGQSIVKVSAPDAQRSKSK